VVALATLGVVLTTGVVAFVGHLALGLALPVAILFGTMISPTDPVAVVAVFRRLGVPARLVNLIESASLLNDRTGLVLFRVPDRDPGFAVRRGKRGLGVREADHRRPGPRPGGRSAALLRDRIDDFPVEITWPPS
jgi:hypothetical protein